MDDDIELARRKERLIASIAGQRATLADTIRELRGPIAVVDRLVAAMHYLRAHPVLVAAVVAAAVALRRRSVWGLLTRGLAAWRIWRSFAPWRGRVGHALRAYARKS